MESALPAATNEALRLRAATMKRIRAFFDQRGFCEVDTPLLSADSVVDRHLDPVPVVLPHDASHLSVGRALWLQTSPEFAMKRLLCGGMSAIYQITHAFRIGERGHQHNPEFCMLEWYRVGDDLHAGMALLAEFAGEFLAKDCTQISFLQAFRDVLGIDPLRASVHELAGVANQHEVALPERAEGDRELLVECLLSELVQPTLGQTGPVIVYDYPGWQSALAKTRSDSGVAGDRVEVAERFELFYRGVELANGYHELTDADELRRRSQSINQLRREDGKFEIDDKSRLWEAMRIGMPACSGVALGFDRLMMVLMQVDTIDRVIPFPIERA